MTGTSVEWTCMGLEQNTSGISQYVMCLDLLFENVLYFSLCVTHTCGCTQHHVTVSKSLGLVRISAHSHTPHITMYHMQKCFSWKHVK